jgi:putative heme-binding domain-containing protein
MEEQRIAGIRLLAVSREVKDLDVLAALLTPKQSPAVQDAALASLAMLRFDMVPQRLLAEFSTFSPRLRGQAINVLLSREAWTRQLLLQMEQGKVAAHQFDAAARQRLLQHRDEAVRRQAAKLLAVAGNPDRKKILEQFQVVLTMKGDVEKGKAAFRQRCAACHQLEGFGHVVGPDLMALTDKSPQAMLTAIIDPNAAVEDKFLDYIATTTDGRILTGMLADETGTSITLKAGEGKDQVILRNQVDDLRSSGKSLMPEGIEKDVTAEQIADVIAYIQAAVGDALKKR